MKRREGPVRASECCNLPTVLVEAMCRQGPQRYIVRQRVEVGARPAAPQAHGRALLIEHLWDDGTRRASHRWWGAAIDPRDGLTQDKPVSRVGEHQHDVWLNREVRERPVERA